MPKFRTILELTIKAKTQADADEVGNGAAEHLLETFNDDESIKSSIRVVSDGPVNVIVPADVLADLVFAANYAAAEQDTEAAAFKKHGDAMSARECTARAKEWRKAFRTGSRFLRAVQPKTKRAAA